MKYLIAISIVVFILLILNACVGDGIKKPERTYEEEILLEHNLEANTYTFEFLDKKNIWTIYQGPSSDKIDWKKPIATFEGEMLSVPAIENEPRTFFGLVSEKDTFLLSERRLSLKGASNFRDLGGIPTTEGRFVKWGKLYRSNRLSDLSKNDLAFLEDLELKIVADFRYDVEVEKHPDLVPNGATYHQYAIGDKEGTRYLEMKKKVRSGVTALEVKEMFIGIMEEFATEGTVFFLPVFDHLLAEEVPLVFHCTGGKDRTGYMSAMILSALGVDRETIMKEYLMSNYYRYEDNRSNYRKGLLVGIDRKVLATGFLVKEAYMNKVWEVIDEEYGGTQYYLEKRFGLTPDKIERLKELYTYDIKDKTPGFVQIQQPIEQSESISDVTPRDISTN